MNEVESAALEGIIRRGNTAGADSLSAEERTIWLIAELDTTMQMAGIEDYLSSHFGGCALDAAAALESIGAPQAAHIVREACKVFSSGQPPTDWEQRRQELSLIDSYTCQHLSDLSDAYLLYPDDLGTKFEEYFHAFTANRSP